MPTLMCRVFEHDARNGIGVFEHDLVRCGRTDRRDDALADTRQHGLLTGTADQLLALRQGEVDFSVAKVADFASFTSEVKVLAVYNQERLEGYPDVPTMGELGYYDQWLGSSRCIVAPAGTPENVIKFYEDAFQKLMEDADYLKAAEAAGMETDYKNSADTAALIKQQQDFTESLADVWGD